MESFTQWVTHPGSGLETMIWSSAQPRNVLNMAKVCFGEEGMERLKAIWARDTLGLTPEEYSRKVQTVKDLNLIWKKMPSFSMQNTILLDDSVLKAHLQPYNHLVLTEYTSELAYIDRECSDQISPSTSTSDLDGDELPESHEQPLAKDRVDGKLAHDQMLLAVIGILAAAVRQTNVPGWIRASLWEPRVGLRAMAGGSNSPLLSACPAAAPESSSAQDAAPIVHTGSALRIPPTVERLWYDDPAVLAEWVSRGESELTRLGIPLRHGLKGRMMLPPGENISNTSEIHAPHGYVGGVNRMF